MDLTQLRHRLEQEKGRHKQIISDLSLAQAQLQGFKLGSLNVEQAQLIIQAVAQETQAKLSFFINDMVTAAIEAIFPDDNYSFFLEFVPRRGRTEADLFLADPEGNRIRPSDADGGGLVNVVALALRVALWSLEKSTRNVMILDEPVHFLHSREAHSRVAELLEMLSRELKLQIIMITGEDESEEIMARADRVIRIGKKKGISFVSFKEER